MDRLIATVVAAMAVSSLSCESPKSSQSETPGTRGLHYKPAAAAGVDLGGVYGRSHAVVIGVDKYRSVPQLDGAVRDAKEVAQALEARGFEVTLLLDEQASRSAVAEELGDRLHGRVGPNDRVIVFFAGHGFSTGDGDHRMGYLLPVEGDRSAVRATGLSMSELQNWLAGYPAKHVLFVADACYSGLALATRSTGLDPATKGYLEDVTSRRVRFTLVAGRDDQEAHEDAQSGHGVFTRFFLEGLDGAADVNQDGLVTSDELGVYVKPQVSTYVAQNFNSSQTPQSARSGMGEFVFFAKGAPGPAPAAAAPAPAPAPAPVATKERKSPPAETKPEPAPAPSKPAPAEPAPKVGPALPAGVQLVGNEIIVTTVSASRYRGNLVKAIDSARKKQTKKLLELLAGPKYNVPESQLAARVDALVKAGKQDKLRGGENDDGDHELVVRYPAP